MRHRTRYFISSSLGLMAVCTFVTLLVGIVSKVEPRDRAIKLYSGVARELHADGRGVQGRTEGKLNNDAFWLRSHINRAISEMQTAEEWEPAVFDFIAEKAQFNVCRRYFGTAVAEASRNGESTDGMFDRVLMGRGRYLPPDLYEKAQVDKEIGTDPISDAVAGYNGLAETILNAEFNVEAQRAQGHLDFMLGALCLLLIAICVLSAIIILPD